MAKITSREQKISDTPSTTKKPVFLRFLRGKIVASSGKVRLVLLMVVVGLGLGAWQLFSQSNQAEVTYETATVEKGTLISSISASGTITSGNYTNVTTKTSGVVNAVYVVNGETVTKGAKIAEVTLDEYARERQSEAWVNYLKAKEESLAAKNAKSQADIAMWTAREDILNAEEAIKDMNDDPINPQSKEVYTEGERTIITKTLEQKRLAYTVAESAYKDADARIADASAKVTAALRDYQENSSTILAPAAGTITDLALAEGIIVSASSTTSQTSGATIVSAQTVGKINDSKGQLIASVSLTEMDIINVQANQKVTLTLDAYEDTSFTGKVLAVNTSGSVSSGVTAYPVTILLDSVDKAIYPNMAVSVEIITTITSEVLLIPSTAITTSDGQATVEVMRNGSPTPVTVETGISNDSQTEIVSGLSQGDEVVTATLGLDEVESAETTTSPFSGVSGSRGRSSGGFGGGVPAGGPPGGF